MEEPKKNKRGGRKKLPEKEKRKHRIEIKCLEEEKEQIYSMAKLLGITVTDYIVNKALDRGILINRLEIVGEVHKIGTEISRCGNNINQIAKHINSQNKLGISTDSWKEDYNKLLEDYIKTHSELRTTFRSLLRELSRK